MLVCFDALGCRLNEAEIEGWAGEFVVRGHQVTTDAAEADLVVFNSCAVTGAAERKSRQRIARLRRANPGARLVVTGCHASLHPEQVRGTLGVDLVVDNRDKSALVGEALALAGAAGSAAPAVDFDAVSSGLLRRGRQRAFVKIQDGCRYRCTYCIVTLARGEERSRGEAEIVAEIDRLHAGGIDEVALTGVHVGGYGSDTGSSLYRLLSEILARTAIPRIRLASVEPWDLPANFFDLFADARLMPHMHLPLQSGSDSVLRRMARRCKTAEFARLVERARARVELFNVTTDVIVGFPGESAAEWRQTLAFVEAVGFGHLHIFPFSARAGTKAARLPGQVDAALKKSRAAELRALAAELKRRELARHVGGHAAVLWERRLDDGAGPCSGYTPHYHRIVSPDPTLAAGAITTVRIDGLCDDGAALASGMPRRAVAAVDIDFHARGG